MTAGREDPGQVRASGRVFLAFLHHVEPLLMATLVLWVCSSQRLRADVAYDATTPPSDTDAETDTDSDANGGSTDGGSTGDPSTTDTLPDDDVEGVGDGLDGESGGTAYCDGSEWTPAGTTTDQAAVEETMADHEARALPSPVPCSARCPHGPTNVGSA